MRWKLPLFVGVSSGGSGAAVALLNQWAERATLTPTGSQYTLELAGLLAFPFLSSALLSVPVGCALLAFRRTRRWGQLSVIAGSAFFLVLWGFNSLDGDVRIEAFRKVADAGGPVVRAIRAYEQAKSRAPASLDLLVPEFLGTIPGTGLGPYPLFDYQVSAPGEDVFGSPWMLYVACSSGGINFDRFVYLPSGDYSRYDSWGYVERVGDWAYVHE